MEIISSIEDKYYTEEKIIFIYFDPNNQLEEFKNRLKLIFEDIICPTTFEFILNLIESMKEEKIFFLTLYSEVSQILSNVDIFRYVNSIFIFCSETDEVEEEIDLINRENYKWIFFNSENYLKKDLSKQVNDFLWIHFFHHIISIFLHDDKAKQQMFATFNHYYQNNSKEIQSINQFKDEYPSNQAIYCYFKYSFIQNIINKAIQNEEY